MPLNQETINDNAKLIMHRLVARALMRDPHLVDRARIELEKIAARFPRQAFVAEWKKLLGLPMSELRVRLTSRHQDMKRLRLSSPFVTVQGLDFTDQVLRRRIRRTAKKIALRSEFGGQANRPMAA